MESRELVAAQAADIEQMAETIITSSKGKSTAQTIAACAVVIAICADISNNSKQQILETVEFAYDRCKEACNGN